MASSPMRRAEAVALAVRMVKQGLDRHTAARLFRVSMHEVDRAITLGEIEDEAAWARLGLRRDMQTLI